MLLHNLYKELLDSEEESKYLVIAKVFSQVLGRKVRRNEWGFLRRLINLYSYDTVFWAIVASLGINSDANPLKYVAAVCKNITKEDIESQPPQIGEELSELLDYMKNYKQPDWEKILNDSDKTT